MELTSWNGTYLTGIIVTPTHDSFVAGADATVVLVTAIQSVEGSKPNAGLTGEIRSPTLGVAI
jgi:hypothetical protein